MQKAIVSPFHKKNSIQDKENYRPVSILPILSKLYERAINAKLTDFFETKGGRALRGKFGPLWSQKLKVAFRQFHPIGLLEECSKCKVLAFILLLPLLW